MLDERKYLKSRWDQTRCGKMHARVCTTESPGDQPNVVLVHGLVVSSLYMVPTAVRLASSFPVYAPDLPGFGRSAKPGHILSISELAGALDAWLDALQLEHVVLVGNSMGCQIICELMFRHPRQVIATVLSAPSIDSQARTTSQQFVRWLLNWAHEQPVLAVIQALDFCRAGPIRAWKTFQHALRHPVEDRLANVCVPSLVVRGSEDRIVSQQWVEEVTLRLAKGELIQITDGPHMINYTSADAFARVVRNFIKNIPSSNA